MKTKTMFIVVISVLVMLAACKFGTMLLNSYFENLTNTLFAF